MDADYSEYAFIQLSEDKDRVTGIISGFDTTQPGRLIHNYYLDGTIGPNTAYISMTVEDWNSQEIHPSFDSLYSIIIDKNPYSEFYYGQRTDFYTETDGWRGIDTAYLNILIIEDRLDEYFTKVK